jgi:hypothetical protein
MLQTTRRSIAPFLALALCLLLWTGSASAQDCLRETEPNETPAEANRLGRLSCAVGGLAGGDQDAFVWTVDEEGAGLVWTLQVQSIPGQLTVANLFRVTFADNGVDVTAADEILSFGTRDGSFNESAPFLVAPGSYLLGTSASGGQGEYVLRLAPGELVRRSRSNGDSSQRVEGTFSLFGMLEGERRWPWTIDPDDAGKRWQLELLGSLGSALELELIGPDGTRVVSGISRGEPLQLSSLGLAEGEHTLTLRGGDGGPYQLSAVSLGLLTDGGEVEPNNRWDDANVVTFERPVTGAGTDIDYFVFDVGPELAGTPFDLVVESDANLGIALFDADRNELQRRRGTAGSLRGLVLNEGAYGLEIRASGERYQLSLVPGGAAPREGVEIEPNDTLRGATAMGEELTVRGVLGPQDTDSYRFTTEGEPQVWRLQVLGQGRLEIITFNGGGIQQQTLSGDRRVRLDNVVLLPGEHFVQIEGDEGEYALRALALGPAPEPPPPAPAAETAPLEPAPAPPAQDEVEAAPVGPPPPPGLLEAEPNGDQSRAELLEAGVTRVGALTGSRDNDTYRFFLANDQYVRIEAVPPEDGDIFFDVGGVRARALGPGQPAVLERWLLAGDYFLNLRSAEISGGFYQLRLGLLDPLALPDDVEPNDTEGTANPVPSDLVIDGEVGRVGQRDYFALPVPAVETELQIDIEVGAEHRLTLFREDGGRFDQDGTSYRVTMPAGEPSFVRVMGSGAYRLRLTLSVPPEASALAPSNDPAEADLTFAEARAPVTAYWFRGQRFETELTLRNTSERSQSYAIAAASSHVTIVLSVPTSVTLGPGEVRSLPLTVRLPHDLRDDQPIRLTVAARDDVGVISTSLTLEPTCEAPPVNSELSWALPDPLLGGLNVAWSGLGSMVVDSDRNRDPQMFDGRTSPATGGYAERDVEVTVALPGDAPILLTGTLLHTQAGTTVERQLAEFELLVSLDGIDFTPVLAGELQAARVEQAFVFDAPVPARFARLRFGSGQDGRSGSWLGEWKLVAAEDTFVGRINLADPELGGHVVWSDPLVQTNNSDHAILNEEPNGSQIDARFIDEITWVVGFHHTRAAQIEEIVWVEQERSNEEDRFERVVVQASLAGPVGPWRDLAEWELQRDAAGMATLTFDAPEWVRFLRFTAPKPQSSDRFFPPQTLRVFERSASDGYRSALGEWGHYRRDAIFELLDDGGGPLALEEADDNDSRDRAQPLTSGDAVEGSVQIVEDLDWFRFTIPQGENMLEVALEGDPTVNYLYQLFDAAGEPLVFDFDEDGDRLILRYFGDPGTYFLRIEEPKRSVIFSWDTSGSVGPYTPITYNSLARFARDLDPEREFVQLLAFNDPKPIWLLPYWSADPLRVQGMINSFDRRADSSNAENGLLTASLALEEREGTRAVLFMTDAESGGYGLTPELWRSLERSRARVFTFEISTSGSDYSQDLMQSWASVNSGFYDYARNVADFDVGFARAACLLRRPKRYRVEVTTAFREPPGPGALRILRGEGSAPPAVEVIFDASGSMGKLLPSGVPRIDAAKEVLTDFVANVLPDGAGFALRAYGHILPSSCETRLDVPLGPLDRDEALAAIDAIEPKLLSQTPIADSLLAVAGDLSEATGPTTVVLLTDGLESCNGDPRAAVEQLRADGVQLQLAIISLGLEDPEDVAVFEALAEAVGASYVDAQDLGTLEASISAALRPGFEVLDAAGAVVARGTVEGDPVPLPGGLYTVRVLSSPVTVLNDVRVPAETVVEVPLGTP